MPITIRRVCGAVFIIACLTAACSASAADQAPPIDPVPADNSDLADIQAKAEAAQAFAEQCHGMKCPQFDCLAAVTLFEALYARMQLLQAMMPWLEQANDDHMAHFQSLVEQGIITGENMANAQNALAWQQYLHNIGSALLDIADLKGIADKILEDPSKLTNENFEKLVNNLYRFDKAIKKSESLVSTTAGGATASDVPKPYAGLTPDVGGVTGGDINTMKNLSGEALGAIDAVKEGVAEGIKKGLTKQQAWKKALTAPGGPRENLLSVLGTVAAKISEMHIAERIAHIESLNRDLNASDLVQAQAFQDLQRIQNRRFAAMDALTAVKAALPGLEACITANGCEIPTRVRLRLPDFTETTPGGKPKSSWGKALTFFNQALSRPVPPVPEIKDECPPATGDTVGFIPDWGVTYDSPVWCTYGGGTTGVPPATGGPGIVYFPPPAIPGTGGGPNSTPPPGGGEQPGGTPPPGGEQPGGQPAGGGPATTTGEPGPEGGDNGPGSAPGPTIYVKAKRSVLAGGGKTSAVAGAMIKLDLGPAPALPVAGNPKPDTGFDQPPIQGVTDADGELALNVPPTMAGAVPAGFQTGLELDLTPQSSTVLHMGPNAQPGKQLATGLQQYVSRVLTLAGTTYVVLHYPETSAGAVKQLIAQSGNVAYAEENYCRDKQAAPNDPYFAGRGSWGQAYDDQWAIKRVGLTADAESAWNRLGADPKPVVVAVIDSGLDWNHADIDWRNIWRNPGETPGNGVDDDGNGYVDDVIGWNFFDNDNKPWDRDGHGTFVAGLIGAATGNGTGIAGINPYARIMPLKALNAFGHSRASFIAEAIVYAADQGARVINLSVGGKHLTRIEQNAIDHAHAKGAVIVVAAGNEGVDTSGYGPAGAGKVLTVSATDIDDKRTVFSNWGGAVDLAAPGVDVLSLRARRSDLMRDIPGVDYSPNAAFVGDDTRYYRASGTSFAAPIVAGVASLLLSARPGLSNAQVERMLRQSARDIETPGRDQYTGYGLVDARAALAADPAFYLIAAVDGVSVAAGAGGQVVRVAGTLAANDLAGGRLEIGAGKTPQRWKAVARLDGPVENATLGDIPAGAFRGAPVWTIRLVAEHADGTTREARFLLNLGG